MHYAIAYELDTMIDVLLEWGADLEKKACYEDSPISLAISNDYKYAVDLFEDYKRIYH